MWVTGLGVCRGCNVHAYIHTEKNGNIVENWKEVVDDYGRQDGQLDLELYCELYRQF